MASGLQAADPGPVGPQAARIPATATAGSPLMTSAAMLPMALASCPAGGCGLSR